MTILGLHHITSVSSDAQRTTDFYTKVLGMRLVKQTINFDDPTSYHLYFGDETGSPGTAITYFEWKGAPRGRRGIGGTHHYALRVPTYDALLKWKRRLTAHGLRVNGPLGRNYFTSIYFTDPDGVIIEIATDEPGFAVDEDVPGTEYKAPPEQMVIDNRDTERIAAETWSEPVETITSDMALLNGMHHITAIGQDIHRSNEFYYGLLGMNLVKMTSNFDDPSSAHWYWGTDDGRPGTVITYFERHPKNTQYSRMGVGHTHHFALAVENEESQLIWRERLIKAGLRVSPVMNRDYFKSIYTQDPDGHIVELATLGPGFATDEPLETLGTTLQIPEMHQAQRSYIEANLKPLDVPIWKKTTEVE
jgi:glyoxalase family protein